MVRRCRCPCAEMLEIVSDAFLDLDTRRSAPSIIKRRCRRRSWNRMRRRSPPTSEDADAALSFLVGRSMVVVDGDVVI